MKHDTRALTPRPFVPTKLDPNFWTDQLLEAQREAADMAEDRGRRELAIGLIGVMLLAIVGVAALVIL